MNIASTRVASPTVAPAADPAAVDSSTAGADATQAGTFGRVLSDSLRAQATTGGSNGAGPTGESAQPDADLGAVATRSADGRGITVTCADPAIAMPSDAATGDPGAPAMTGTTDAKALATADPASGLTQDPLANARATGPAGQQASGNVRATPLDPTAVDPKTADAGILVDNAAPFKNDAKADAKSDDDKPDPAATDLAAQIALVSQWAALAQPAANVAGDAKTVAATRGDIRAKLETVRAAGSKVTATAIDPNALKDAVGGLAGASAALALERATHGQTAPSGATQAADAGFADALSGASAATTSNAKTSSMEKLMALAANVMHGTSEPTTLSNLAQQVATQAAAGLTTFTQPTVDAASAANQTATTGLAVLHEQVGTAAWSHEVGQAALRMASDDLQNVSLRLHPEHLGPLDVQMRIDNGIAHLQFAAAHVETRQALEASKTTLDNLFNQQGMKLGEWSVGQQSSGSSFAQNFGTQAGGGSGTSGTRGGADDDGASDTTTITVRTQRALGLVDTFA